MTTPRGRPKTREEYLEEYYRLTGEKRPEPSAPPTEPTLGVKPAPAVLESTPRQNRGSTVTTEPALPARKPLPVSKPPDDGSVLERVEATLKGRRPWTPMLRLRKPWESGLDMLETVGLPFEYAAGVAFKPLLHPGEFIRGEGPAPWEPFGVVKRQRERSLPEQIGTGLALDPKGLLSLGKAGVRLGTGLIRRAGRIGGKPVPAGSPSVAPVAGSFEATVDGQRMSFPDTPEARRFVAENTASAPPELTALERAQVAMDEAAANLEATKATGVRAPKFGTAERAEFDAAQRGKPNKKTRVADAKTRLERRQQEVSQLEAEQIGNIQAGMGIGEPSTQGGLFENLPKGPEPVPLIDAEKLAAQGVRRAEVAGGQGELLSVVEPKIEKVERTILASRGGFGSPFKQITTLVDGKYRVQNIPSYKGYNLSSRPIWMVVDDTTDPFLADPDLAAKMIPGERLAGGEVPHSVMVSAFVPEGKGVKILKGGFTTQREALAYAKGLAKQAPKADEAVPPAAAKQELPVAAPHLPKMTDNYVKPLSFYAPKLYQEVHPDLALRYLPGAKILTEMGQEFLSNTPNLALGQGNNKGIIATFRSGDIPGQVNFAKPGLDFAYQNGEAEFVVRHGTQKQFQDSLESLTIKPDATMRTSTRVILKRELSAWTKVKNTDGSVTFNRPAAVPPAAGSAMPPIGPGAAEAALPPAAFPAAGTKPPPPPPKMPSVPAEAAGEAFAGNIRLSKYPEELRGELKSWADANPEAVQEARRGVRSDAQVQADARQLFDEIGGDYERWLKKKGKPGAAFNAEEITAVRGLLRVKATAADEARKAVQAANTPANQANFVLALQESAAAQKVVTGGTAEMGRGLRALRQAVFEATRSNDSRKIEEIVSRLYKKYHKEGLGRSPQESIAALADGFAALDLNNPAAVNEFIRKASNPSLWDYAFEIWINSLLSSPKTHIINELSNTINTLGSPMERGMAAGVESALARLQRRQRGIGFGEAFADIQGAMEGLPDAARSGLYTLRHGMTPSAASKWEFRKQAFGGKLGRVVRAPGTFLEAADTAHFTINHRQALRALAYRQARSEGLKGQAFAARYAELVASPPDKLFAQAARIADYRLFKDESALANMLINNRERYPILKLVIPFVRTPINITKYGIERSPLGLLNPGLLRNLRKGSPEASEQIARVLLGSGIAGTLAWLVAKGKITGPVPSNKAERDRFYREGKIPFSLQIGDRWVQYQRLEPFNQPLMQVSTTAQAIKEGDKSALATAGQIGATIGKNLVSQTYMSGIDDILNAIIDPERYGEDYLARFTQSAVPASSLLRTAAQTADPTFRKPETVLETVAAGLPGASRLAPPRLTAFGEEARRESPAVSPISVTPARQSAVDAELERLGVEVGFVGTSINGNKLTPREQRRYQEIGGQKTYAALEQELRSGPLSEEDVAKAVRDGREEARRLVTREFPRLRTKPGTRAGERR